MTPMPIEVEGASMVWLATLLPAYVSWDSVHQGTGSHKIGASDIWALD